MIHNADIGLPAGATTCLVSAAAAAAAANRLLFAKKSLNMAWKNGAWNCIDVDENVQAKRDEIYRWKIEVKLTQQLSFIYDLKSSEPLVHL